MLDGVQARHANEVSGTRSSTVEVWRAANNTSAAKTHGAEGDRTLLRLIDSQVATPVALDPMCSFEKRRVEESNSQP